MTAFGATASTHSYGEARSDGGTDDPSQVLSPVAVEVMYCFRTSLWSCIQ